MAEVFQRSALRESALRAEIGDFQRLLQRQAGRHDFANQTPYLVVAERSLVELLEAADHLGFAIGAEKIDAVVAALAEPAFDFGDLYRAAGALVEELEQLFIEGIDTSIPLHRQIVRDDRFRHGDVSTRFMERFRPETPKQAAVGA